ncbi:MAG: galactitol-1-phosphate 5-dehydrogenase [Acidobacteria bacterium]|nr:MAG: galactitol-1-phosphate 5-dehydrogenase [Acidobacteriota bacterium]
MKSARDYRSEHGSVKRCHNRILMKALVYTAPLRLEMRELADPQPKAGEVLVRIRAVGVCGSDLNGFLGRSKKRVPPLVLGHEFSGEVATSDGVGDIALGAAVAVYPIVSCGTCEYCVTQRDNLCAARQVYGLDFHGGLAEYASVPARCLFRMPPSISFVEGSLVEPLANAIHVVGRCGAIRGRTGLIYGAGPIGILCALVTKQNGARIAVVDRNVHRLTRTKELTAALAVDATALDPVTSVIEWTGGRGVDFAIDAVGTAQCRQNSIACTASGGAVICIGLEDEVCAVDTRPIVTREVDVKGAYAYTRPDFAEALSMLARKLLPWESLVTKSALPQGQAIFDDLASGHSSILKAVFEI